MTQMLVPTVCPYCSAGCKFFIAVEKERATGIEYMPDHPVSEGALCSKRNAALEILYHQERLTSPLRKKGEGWVKISWEEAIKEWLTDRDYIAQRTRGFEALAESVKDRFILTLTDALAAVPAR